MAYTMKLGFDDLPRIYNLSSSVGRGMANLRDDVMLVQFLLKIAHYPVLMGGLPSGSTSSITVDGYYGQETARMVNAMEVWEARSKKLLIADGFLEPAPPDGYTRSGVLYKIVHLNRAARKRDQPLYDWMPWEQETPMLLRNSLMRGAARPKTAGAT